MEKKKALALEKSALFLCIYGLKFHLKCSFKSMLEKKHQNIFVNETFINVSLFQETSPAWKNSWLRACTN